MDALTDSSGTTGGELNDFIDLPRKTGKMHPMARGKRKRGPDMTQRQQTIEVSVEKYDPDQPRDDHGRFGSGGGTAQTRTPAPRAASSGKQKQAATVKRLVSRFGMHDPNKAQPIGTNRLKEAMSEAFAMGAVHGDRGDNGALGHEIDTAVRASGSAELKTVANAIDRDDGEARSKILDRIFHDKVTQHGGPIDRVREVQVNGKKFEAALTAAYAEGVKASEAIKDFVRSHPGGSSIPDTVSYFGRPRMKKATAMKSIEVEVIEKFDPDQPRDDHGRFGSGSGGSGKVPKGRNHQNSEKVSSAGKAAYAEVAQTKAGRIAVNTALKTLGAPLKNSSPTTLVTSTTDKLKAALDQAYVAGMKSDPADVATIQTAKESLYDLLDNEQRNIGIDSDRPSALQADAETVRRFEAGEADESATRSVASNYLGVSGVDYGSEPIEVTAGKAASAMGLAYLAGRNAARSAANKMRPLGATLGSRMRKSVEMAKSIEVEVIEKYDPDQPRDESGRFGSGGGGGSKSGGGGDKGSGKGSPAFPNMKLATKPVAIHMHADATGREKSTITQGAGKAPPSAVASELVTILELTAKPTAAKVTVEFVDPKLEAGGKPGSVTAMEVTPGGSYKGLKDTFEQHAARGLQYRVHVVSKPNLFAAPRRTSNSGL